MTSKSLVVLALVVLGAASPAAGQSDASDLLRSNALVISGDHGDMLRIAELADSAAHGLLLRSPSTLLLTERRSRLLGPYIGVVTNSTLPFGQNNGALWAGRGLNARVIGGGLLAAGPLAITLLPELVSSSNGEFTFRHQATPAIPPNRSEWSNPWNWVPYSADAPIRFGDEPIRRLHPGQSSVVLGHALQAGVATENNWWGPGLRNAIVLSDNAPGFPHFFLRTGEPVRTRIGNLDARWLVGGVRESRYFDADSTNDVRALSGAALAWTPAPRSGITLGVARVILTPVAGWGSAAGHALDVFTVVATPEARQEQITSVFARASPPASGFEAYLEWARNRMPRSVTDLLERPNDSQGYTVGLQWRSQTAADSPFLAVQAEHTYLEHSPAAVVREQNSYYTSRFRGHGYTHEGQVLGAGIGQGSSGQWLAFDYFTPVNRVGAFGGRTRWNNDAFVALFPFLDLQPGNRGCFHDVTLYGGVRGSWRRWLSLQYTFSRRLNPYFQWVGSCPTAAEAITVNNHSLSLTVLPLR